MPEKNTDYKEAIVHAALALAAEQGWTLTTLRDIAQRAEIPLTTLRGIVDDKTDILALYGKQIDAQVLATLGEVAPAASPRDRLFDILMERFDVLNTHRDGLVSILDSLKCDPKQALIACPHLARSMNWMLEAAGVEASGIKGALKILGLTAVYLKTLKVWRDDTSPDMAKTMAALDKDLSRAEQTANTLGF